jgi:ubiquinone/menaquinone biosynthesis C-methylase UbiE
VADLGCGPYGFLVFPIAQHLGRRGVVYAVDVVKSHLDKIEREAKHHNLLGVKTVWSDIESVGATKIDEASFDLVYIINTLYQAQKATDMLSEAARLLKVGGRLVIVDWSEEAGPLGPPLTQRIKKDKLKTALAQLGFSEEADFNPGPYHFGLVFSKNK